MQGSSELHYFLLQFSITVLAAVDDAPLVMVIEVLSITVLAAVDDAALAMFQLQTF